MSEMVDYIQIGEKYRITSDGRYNLILHEEHEKMEGRGSNAVPTGEFEYRRIGYFRRLDHIGNYLANLEVYKYQGSNLEEIAERVEKLKEEIVESMENIDVTWIKSQQ